MKGLANGFMKKKLLILMIVLCGVLSIGAVVILACNKDKGDSSTPQSTSSEQEIWTPNY